MFTALKLWWWTRRLRSKDAWVRSRAAMSLGQLGDTRAVEPLIKAFRWGDAATAETLGRLGDVRAIEPLVGVLGKGLYGDGDVELHCEAIRSLVKFADARAVEPIISWLPDRQDNPWYDPWPIRREAAMALGKFGDARAVEPLIAALEDRLADMRLVAANALEDIAKRQPACLERIRGVLSKRNEGEA